MTNYDIDELERQGLRDFIDQRYDFVDLETEIQNVWQTKDDLDSITGRLYDDPDGPMTEDEIGNVLCGLSELHETRCKKLWKVFEAILSQRRNSQEAHPVENTVDLPFPLDRGATADNNEITRETGRGVQLDNEGERFRSEGDDPNKWDSGNDEYPEEYSIKKVPKYYRDGMNENPETD